MDPHQAIMDMKVHLATLYDDVKLRGSGRAEFVNVYKGLRAANISLESDNKSWFVELWTAANSPPGEETCVDERVIERREEAIDLICSWLVG